MILEAAVNLVSLLGSEMADWTFDQLQVGVDRSAADLTDLFFFIDTVNILVCAEIQIDLVGLMDQLNRLAQGKEVRLVAVDAKGKDHYGRIVADVILPDGHSLSDTMVRNGAAFVYPHSELNAHFQERLRKLQHEAIAARRGMWAHILTLPAAKKTYLGNRESMRFFPTDCAEVQHIKPRNRVFFGTLMDAFMAGYAPARPCNFWPDAK